MGSPNEANLGPPSLKAASFAAGSVNGEMSSTNIMMMEVLWVLQTLEHVQLLPWPVAMHVVAGAISLFQLLTILRALCNFEAIKCFSELE